MRNQYIFDIPIYRKTKNDFDAEIETHMAKRIEWIISHDPEQRPLSYFVKIQMIFTIFFKVL